MRKSNIFKKVAGYRPGRSAFDMSYEKKFTCDLGELIPVLAEPCVPGDVWTIGCQSVIRMQPLVSPVLHEINMYYHVFFVPNRIMWDSWEDFITGGIDGDDASVHPIWEPTDTAIGSLWDYCGFPTGIDPDGVYPSDFIRIAYAMIYNWFYRDESLIAEVALTNEDILIRAWEKDYYTSALLNQQRGTAPSLPISGSTSAVWGTPSAANDTTLRSDGTLNVPYNSDTKNLLENNTVDLSVASTFDIADLRLAFQIQKFMERNNRAGYRYKEFLQSHFAVSYNDARLQSPEYIGGVKAPIIVSEVLQTSETTTGVGGSPQGTMAGHGINVTQGFCGKYRCEEYGILMGIMSIVPKPVYSSQGVHRKWLKETKYDYFLPEFQNISEQIIVRGELLATAVDTENLTPFGYQGRYDEYRTNENMICGLMRTDFDFWHLARQFDPLTPPELNQSFIECVPRKDIFAVPAEPGLIVSFGNLLKAVRPITAIAEPGLIDHN